MSRRQKELVALSALEFASLAFGDDPMSPGSKIARRQRWGRRKGGAKS